MSDFSFADDNLRTFQWTFTKIDVCTGVVEPWFCITNGQIWSIFVRMICPQVNVSGFSPNLVCAFILWFGITNGQI